RLARFETSRDSGDVNLSTLASHCLAITDADTAGIVLVAESAGLIGAALRRSPASGEAARAPFEHPEIREWISFAPERVFPRSVVLVVGVASKSPDPALSPLLRPLDEEALPAGHFHAAAFTYGPMKRGKIDLRETVSNLYENERLEGVLHLLNDNRRIVGVGQSEFSRGACWIGPISSIVEERGSV
ncbi:MAG: anti-sigma factor antagonist, partial [bacterium]|nr:anti-sigma factor antagonist [bacterium]